MQRYNIFILLSLLSFVSCAQNKQSDMVALNIEAKDFKKQIEGTEIILLDVRTPNEVTNGFIPGAFFVDYFSADFDDKINNLNKSKPVFVYCASGNRSGKAMKKLTDLGFKEVYNLVGGFNQWQALDYPITK